MIRVEKFDEWNALKFNINSQTNLLDKRKSSKNYTSTVYTKKGNVKCSVFFNENTFINAALKL